MTALLSPPHRRDTSEQSRASARAVSLAGALAAGQAAALGLLAVTVIVLVGWATAADTGASASEAVAASLHTWLLAHLAVLSVPGGELGLPPLGLTALGAWLLVGAGQRAARSAVVEDNRAVAALTCALAATYALIATAIAVMARTDAVQPVPVTAFVGAAAIAGASSGVGAIRAADTWRPLWRRLPVRLRVSVVAATGATAVVIGSAALLVAVALGLRISRFAGVVDSLDVGVPGLFLLGLLSLAYAPTAVVWATSFVIGPGFAVGTGTSVGIGGVELGATPVFPLLAALPENGEAAPVAYAVLVAPTAAGVTAALLLERANARRTVGFLDSAQQIVVISSAAGALTGAMLSAVTIVAGGPAGPGRLAEVGASWWQVGASAAVVVAAVAMVTLLVRRLQSLRAAVTWRPRADGERRSRRWRDIRLWPTP